MMSSVKRAIRSVLGRAGYTIRGTGTGVTGVDLLHDARVLLGSKDRKALFDIGANIGQTAWAMLDAFPSADIYSFEPSPGTFETLKRTFAGESRVHVERLAMGERLGTLPFHVTAEHSVNDSLLRPNWEAGASVVEVPVETVTTYCASKGIASVDLLKIDTQGFDLHVLRGARQMLDEKRIRLFTCEVNFEPMYAEQATLIDLVQFASDVNYRLVGVYEQTYHDNELTYFDFMFRAGS